MDRHPIPITFAKDLLHRSMKGRATLQPSLASGKVGHALEAETDDRCDLAESVAVRYCTADQVGATSFNSPEPDDRAVVFCCYVAKCLQIVHASSIPDEETLPECDASLTGFLAVLASTRVA